MQTLPGFGQVYENSFRGDNLKGGRKVAQSAANDPGNRCFGGVSLRNYVVMSDNYVD
jgi:hypothetical protein